MKIINLKKNYSKLLFENLNIDIDIGILNIYGASGSGKTTLLKIILGQIKPDEGEIIIKNNFKYSYYGKDEHLFDKKTIAQNFKIFFNKSIDETMFSYLKMFDLKKYLDQKLINLSGGERQKVQICFCLYKSADIYLMDEPFNNLDEESRVILGNLLSTFAKNHIVVISSHEDLSNYVNINKKILINGDGTCTYKDNDQIINKHTISKTVDTQNEISKRNILIQSFKSFIYENKWIYILKAIMLIVVVSIMSILGLTLYKNDKETSYIKSLNVDPFSYHEVFMSINKETAFTDFQNRFPSNKMVVSYDNEEQKTYFFPSLSNDEIYYLKNENNESIFSEGDLITIQDENLNTKTININYIDRTDSKLSNISFDVEFLKAILDGYDTKSNIVLTSQNIFNQLILNGNLKCSFIPIVYNQLSFNVDNNYLEFKSRGTKKVKLTTLSDYAFMVPGLNANESSTINLTIDKENKIFFNLNVLTTNDCPDDSYIYMGPKLMQMIFTLLKNSYNNTEANTVFTYSFYINKEDTINNLSDIYLIRNIINDYSSMENSKITMAILLVVSLILYLIIIILSQKQFINVFKKNIILLNNNQISKYSIVKFISLIYLLKLIVIVSLSVLIYLICIKYFNYQTMVAAYPYRPSGYYYYSKQPNNPYYDNIKSPIQFLELNNWVYIVIIFPIILSIFDYLFLLYDKRKSKKK